MDIKVFQKIAENYGTPVYVFDRKAFEENYRSFVGIFQKRYPNYRLSYSYKTNYVPYVCKCVKDMGGYAEVVSDMEYNLAKKLGYRNDQIVYNGPVKGALMEEHLLSGGILNVDNVEEAKRVADLATMHPEKEFRLGMRINLHVTEDFVSRFGLEPGSEMLSEAAAILKSCTNIKLVGVHGHSGHARSIASWAKRAETLLRAAAELIDGVPEYISLGSGMFGRPDERLARQFNCEIPSFSDYAETVLSPIATHYAAVDRKPVVFTEPGATVVSGYMYFVTKVTDIKQIRGRYFAATDGSFYNVGEISKSKQLPLDRIALGKESAEYESVDIVGYTCLEYDALYRNYKGSLAVGDVLILGNVGGYSVVSKPQFIQPNCPILAVETDGSVKKIMRQETFEDVFSKFVF